MYTGIFAEENPDSNALKVTDDFTRPLEELKIKVNAAIINSDKGFPDVNDLTTQLTAGGSSLDKVKVNRIDYHNRGLLALIPIKKD
jgi:hypothetical protein